MIAVLKGVRHAASLDEPVKMFSGSYRTHCGIPVGGFDIEDGDDPDCMACIARPRVAEEIVFALHESDVNLRAKERLVNEVDYTQYARKVLK